MDGDQPFLPSLSEASDASLFKVKVFEIKGNELSDPQSAGVNKLKHRAVAHAIRRFLPRCRCEQVIDFFYS